MSLRQLLALRSRRICFELQMRRPQQMPAGTYPISQVLCWGIPRPALLRSIIIGLAAWAQEMSTQTLFGSTIVLRHARPAIAPELPMISGAQVVEHLDWKNAAD